MMLVVIGDLALAPHSASGRIVRGRPSPDVHDFGLCHVQDTASAPAQRHAEVDVFGVHEVALVEQAGGLQIPSADQEARATHPDHIAVQAAQTVDVAHDGLQPDESAAMETE